MSHRIEARGRRRRDRADAMMFGSLAAA